MSKLYYETEEYSEAENELDTYDDPVKLVMEYRVSEKQKDQQIVELQKQLEEKEKEIEKQKNLFKLSNDVVLKQGEEMFSLRVKVLQQDQIIKQLKSQPAEIVEKIKDYKGCYFEWKIGDKIYPAFKITEEDLDNILKEYQK